MSTTPGAVAPTEAPATTATSTSPAPRRDPPPEIQRFDIVERLVHWSTAALLLTLLATGSILYIPALATTVNSRALVEEIHVYCGLALLGPLVLGVVGPWRTRLLSDLRRFDRWSLADWDWWRRRHNRTKAPRGKFNGGQKAEAALLGGGMAVMLITGVVMRWSPHPFPVHWATGATFVHDIFYVVLFVAVVAHIGFALYNPDQFKSMFTGRIPRKWAEHHAPAWVKAIDEAALNTTIRKGAVPGATKGPQPRP